MPNITLAECLNAVSDAVLTAQQTAQAAFMCRQGQSIEAILQAMGLM